jgi:peptidoglycan/LPS O-acetylase OafA/YrhL
MLEKNNNLNLLRLIAAFFVLFEHSFAISGKQNPINFLSEGFGSLGVKIFFVVSGFLIVSSWNSSPKVLPFIWRRILRIFPALIVVVLIAAYILGPILSNLQLKEYLQSPGTSFYLMNIALFPVFALPGVLETAPVPHAINGSLWTLPLEVMLYVTVLAIGFFSKINKSRYSLFLAGYIALYMMAKVSTTNFVYYGTDWRLFVIYGLYFYVGGYFSVIKYQGNLNINLITLSFFVTVVASTYHSALSDIVQAASISYIVLTFGLSSSKWGTWINQKGDFSYGFYIYAFPIQQIIFSCFKWKGMFFYILICSTLTLLCAAISWFFIEKKMLSLKNWI